MESGIDRAWRLARHLPGVEKGEWYGTPALKLRRSPPQAVGIARMKALGELVVLCPPGLKEAMMEAEPDLYWETAHYRGWPAMLVHLDRIDDDSLVDRLECAWREKAPKRMLED